MKKQMKWKLIYMLLMGASVSPFVTTDIFADEEAGEDIIGSDLAEPEEKPDLEPVEPEPTDPIPELDTVMSARSGDDGFDIPDEALAQGDYGVQWYVGLDGVLHIQAGQMNNLDLPDWGGMAAEVQAVQIDPAGTQTDLVVGQKARGLFSHMEKLTSFSFENIDTSALESADGMFTYCTSLTDIDLSKMDLSNCISLHAMFWGCSNLAAFDFAQVDLSNVESLESMFIDCSNLKSVNLTGADFSKISNTFTLFQGCSSLESVDFTGVDMGNVFWANFLFDGCTSLKEVKGLHLPNVQVANSMFLGCSNLESVELTGLESGTATTLAYLFSGCSSLESVNLAQFNTQNVTEFAGMFKGCSALKSLDLSSFNTAKATAADSAVDMFTGLDSLESVTIGPDFFESQSVKEAFVSGIGRRLKKEGTSDYQSLAELADNWQAGDAGVYVIEPDYAVTFIVDEANPEEKKSLSLKMGTELSTVINPVKRGHEFLGWYDCAGNRLETVPAEDTVLYGKWKVCTYVVTLNPGTSAKPEEIEAQFGDIIELPVLKRDGYVFEGWFQRFEVEPVTDVKVLGNMTLTARWSPAATVSLESEGTVWKTLTVKNGLVLSLEDYAPERKGFTFLGWFLDENLASPAEEVRAGQNMTLYAGWKKNQHTVTLHNTDLPEETVDAGSLFDLESIKPEKEGHVFGGWYLDNGLTIPAENLSVVDKDLDLYAKWDEAHISDEEPENTGSEEKETEEKPVQNNSGTTPASPAPAISGTAAQSDTGFMERSGVLLGAAFLSILGIVNKKRK